MFNWFIGLAPIATKLGISLGVIGALLTFAWFSPFFRKTALWVAGAVALGGVLYASGLHDQGKRDAARWNVAVDEEIKNAKQDRIDADTLVDRSGDDGMSDDANNRDRGARR